MCIEYPSQVAYYYYTSNQYTPGSQIEEDSVFQLSAFGPLDFILTPIRIIDTSTPSLYFGVVAVNPDSEDSSSSTGPASVVSDPRFIGFWGQSFYVSGAVGGVYNLLSDAQVQVNGYVVQLQHIRCPTVDARTMQRCFDEQGTYFGVLAIRVQGGDYVRIMAGEVDIGFHSVSIGDARSLQVGERYTTPAAPAQAEHRHMRGDSSHADATTLPVHRASARSVLVHVGLYSFRIDSVDLYADISWLEVDSWDKLVSSAQPDGPLGRTWNASLDVQRSDAEGEQFRL